NSRPILYFEHLPATAGEDHEIARPKGIRDADGSERSAFAYNLEFVDCLEDGKKLVAVDQLFSEWTKHQGTVDVLLQQRRIGCTHPAKQRFEHFRIDRDKWSGASEKIISRLGIGPTFFGNERKDLVQEC